MFKFRAGAGAVVAHDTQNTVAAVDDALVNGMRMCASFLEATKGSNLPTARSQKVLTSMAAGLSQMVDGRASFVSSIRELAVIKAQSNFAPEDFGCPDGWVPAMKEAEPASIDAPVNA